MTTIPDYMPVLSRGAHDPSAGRACVMEYVSLLAGEAWTDFPSCTSPVLARAAQLVNDNLEDEDRHLLVPLIGRLFGTNDRSVPGINYHLALWGTAEILPISNDHAGNGYRYRTAVGAVRLWLHDPATNYRLCERAYHEICDDGTGFSDAQEYAAQAIEQLLCGSCLNRIPTETYAPMSSIAYSVRAKDADRGPVAGVQFLSGLIDEYDRLTGRTEHRQLNDTDLGSLKALVG